MSGLVTDPEALQSIINSGDTDSIITVLQALKSYAKRNPINLTYARSYFISLQAVLRSQIPLLHSLTHSCCGHLIKRIISQNSHALADLLDVAVPVIMHGLGDQKSSIRLSCAAVLNDVFAVCPDKLDPLFRDLGLQSTDLTIILSSLEILQHRVETIPSLSFKIFTSSVVALLQTHGSEQKAKSILIEFFKSARQIAKNDLANELSRQSIDPDLTSSILSSIGFAQESQTQQQQQQAHDMSSPSFSLEKSKTESAINIDFFLKDPRYEPEHLTPEECSLDTFDYNIARMLPAFEGKETEFNWQQRETYIMQIRCLLRGNIPLEYPEQFCNGFKQLSDAIIKAASSLRTVLSTSSLLLIKEAFLLLGPVLNSTAELFLNATLKFASITKRITSSNGMLAASAIILKTNYTPKTVQHIVFCSNDKNSQPRLFAARMILILLYANQTIKNVIDASGGRESIEKCIVKALSDANTAVREEMRKAFWAYNELWPVYGQRILNSLDSSVRKALERSNPSGNISFSNITGKSSTSFKDFNSTLRDRTSSNISRLSKRDTTREIREKRETSAPPPSHNVLNTSITSNTSGSQHTGFKGNLGLPQRNPNRSATAPVNSSKPISASSRAAVSKPRSTGQPGYLNPTYSATVNATSSAHPNNPTSSSSILKGPPIPGAASANSVIDPNAVKGRRTPSSTTHNSSLVLQQRLLEKLGSNNPDETESGVQLLVEYILKSELSLKEPKSERLLPSSESLSKPLHNLLQKQRQDSAFCKSVQKLSQYPQVISYIRRFLSPTELALEVIYAWSNLQSTSRPNSSASVRSKKSSDDSDDEMMDEPVNSSNSGGIGAKVVEQLISEVGPEHRLSLVTYIVSYRHDFLRKGIDHQTHFSSREIAKASSAALEDDVYALRALKTMASKELCKGIILNSEKVDDIKLLAMYLKYIPDDKKIIKLFTEIKRLIGYIEPPSKPKRDHKKEVKKDVENDSTKHSGGKAYFEPAPNNTNNNTAAEPKTSKTEPAVERVRSPAHSSSGNEAKSVEKQDNENVDHESSRPVSRQSSQPVSQPGSRPMSRQSPQRSPQSVVQQSLSPGPQQSAEPVIQKSPQNNTQTESQSNEQLEKVKNHSDMSEDEDLADGCETHHFANETVMIKRPPQVEEISLGLGSSEDVIPVAYASSMRLASLSDAGKDEESSSSQLQAEVAQVESQSDAKSISEPVDVAGQIMKDNDDDVQMDMDVEVEKPEEHKECESFAANEKETQFKDTVLIAEGKQEESSVEENKTSPSPAKPSSSASSNLSFSSLEPGQNVVNENLDSNKQDATNSEFSKIKNISIKQLNNDFAKVYTPGKWRTFEEQISEVGDNNRTTGNAIAKLCDILQPTGDLESISDYSRSCVTYLTTNPHLVQRQELDSLISKLLEFLTGCSEQAITLSGSVKRSLLLLLDTLAFEDIFKGHENIVVWALINMQGNNLNDQADTTGATGNSQQEAEKAYSGYENESLQRSSQTVVMTASLDVIKKLSDTSSNIFECIVRAIESLLSSYSAPNYISSLKSSSSSVFMMQLWFAYESLTVVCKSGYQFVSNFSQFTSSSLTNPGSSFDNNQATLLELKQDEFLYAVASNMARLGEILAAGLTIHKAMIRRSCYSTLIELLGAFSISTALLSSKQMLKNGHGENKALNGNSINDNHNNSTDINHAGFAGGEDVEMSNNEDHERSVLVNDSLADEKKVDEQSRIKKEGQDELCNMILAKLDKQQIKLLTFLAENTEAL